MSSSSVRARIGAALLVLVLIIAVVVVVAGGMRPQRFYTPADLVGPDAPIGALVRLEGSVIAKSSSALIIATDPQSGTGVRVEFESEPTLVRLVPGASVLVSGVVAAPGLVRQAALLRPSPPSRYEATIDGGS